MPDTGWISPASAVSEVVAATTENGPWSTISGAFDDDYFTAAINDSTVKTALQTCEALVMTQFGLSGLIPTGAIVDGIELEFYEYAVFDHRPNPYFEIICPGLNDTAYATQPTASYTTSGASAPYSVEYNQGTNLVTPAGTLRKYVLGNSSSLWISGVDNSHVTATGFGFAAIYSFGGDYPDNATIQELKIRAHYTGGASDPMSVRDGGLWKTASPFVKDAGIWKPATPSTRDGGIWKSS